MGNHIFVSIFYFSKFKKLMIGGERLNTYKILFCGVLKLLDDKVNNFFKKNYKK